MTDARRRALVAAAAGLLGAALGVAGAGHAYLGEWRRAVAWFSVVLGTGLVLVSVLADPRTVTLGTLPAEVTLPLVGLLGLSVADASRIAARGDGRGDAGAGGPTGSAANARSCRNCGRSLDPAVGFCWYCAERVDADVAAEEGSGTESDGGGRGPTAR
ncbi:MAG: zinc ribbon domain-containing protein [Haloferacaceae archaeon]